MSEVVVTREEGWAEVILNRPEVKNAINGPLGAALGAALREVAADDGVRVVLLRGAEGAFCSGLDLKDFNRDPPPDWLPEFPALWRGAHKALFDCGKPIVGALERYAINGGAALALATDLLITGENAFLQVGEVQQGMAAPYNLAWLRLKHSEALACRIALVGRRFPGSELAAMGVAHQAVADTEVLDASRALTRQLAGYPPGALSRIKAGIRAYNAPDADAWFDRATAAAPAAPQAPRRVDVPGVTGRS